MTYATYMSKLILNQLDGVAPTATLPPHDTFQCNHLSTPGLIALASELIMQLKCSNVVKYFGEIGCFFNRVNQ